MSQEVKKKQPLPRIETYQFAWIFNAACERFSETVRELQNDIVRLKEFPISGPSAANSWGSRQKQAPELIADKEASIAKYLPVIEFCDMMRAKAADASAKEFTRAFKDSFNWPKGKA